MGIDHPGYPYYKHDYTVGFYPAYRGYLEAVRARLPVDLARLFGFGEPADLHDGIVRDFALDFLHREALFRIHRTGPRTLYTVRYGGVSAFSCRVVEDPGFVDAVPGCHDIWRYEDVAVLAEGRYEHSVLFVSGIEVVIRFTSFTLTSEVLAEPGAAPDAGR